MTQRHGISEAPPDAASVTRSSERRYGEEGASAIEIVGSANGFRSRAYPVSAKASLSLQSLLRSSSERAPAAARALGVRSADSDESSPLTVPVILEAEDEDALARASDGFGAGERLTRLASGSFSARITPASVSKLLSHPAVTRIQSKKRSQPTLDRVLPAVGLVADGVRRVPEDGTSVLIAVIDSGFDLSHPMFRDGEDRLRVVGLLDQTEGDNGTEYAAADLAAAWANGKHPGGDPNGHGTHVASIAGGSRFNAYEGVAPGAKFLLVKTDFVETDEALAWVFRKAGDHPCVVNMSLGHHLGAHDGTDAEERLHTKLSGPGRVIVVSAGNEQNDRIHIGGRFSADRAATASFDILRPDRGEPYVVLTLWYAALDQFEVTLVTPWGQKIPIPQQAESYRSSHLQIDVSRQAYVWSKAIQMQIGLRYIDSVIRSRDLRDWRLQVRCRHAAVGRFDGWFHNSGFAAFHDGPLVESARTVGLPATGDGCLAIGSHVSRTRWNSDIGESSDEGVTEGQASSFSSLGPTRDDRQKPEVSAPGQYITAALADHSEFASWDQRAWDAQRMLTIEGTSMAAPVVTGVVALMLQRKPTLDTTQVRRILTSTAHRADAAAVWNPAYGYGKVDVAAALAKV